MLDKEVWFSEMIVLKNGERIENLLYDESVNWEDDPDEDPSTHFEFRTEIQSRSSRGQLPVGTNCLSRE